VELFFSDLYPLDLPDGHRFPASKYRLLRERLLDRDVFSAERMQPSSFVRSDQLTLAHDPAYVEAFESGALEEADIRRIGLPWNEALVQRTRATIGGAVDAMRSALKTGISGQLAGGTHHAHRSFGSGYCVFNDQAVAALVALDENLVDRVAIVDLDVHQGDGTAAIMADDPRVFVLSIHGRKNFPFRKQTSDLDIALEDDTDDATYLHVLDDALPAVTAFRPDLVLYQSGVDLLREDKLGRMALTHEGLAERDRMVFVTCARHGVPVSIAIGGGYADPIDASVVAYANTFEMALQQYSV